MACIGRPTTTGKLCMVPLKIFSSKLWKHGITEDIKHLSMFNKENGIAGWKCEHLNDYKLIKILSDEMAMLTKTVRHGGSP